VLGLVVAEKLYQDQPQMAEGEMTELRAAVVRGDTLARIAQTVNLGDYLYLGKGEEAEWTPPTTVWVWGEKVPLETVRFAAANYLCVELGYGGSKRLIEPYSLRRTKDGNLLLYAVKTTTSELRAYRVDRIESIKVTNTPYKPRYHVEFTSSGTLIAPPTQRVDTSYSSPRPLKSGVIHVIECSYCGRRFKRSTYNTRLRPHKDKNGMYDCPGRFGYEVDRHYT